MPEFFTSTWMTVILAVLVLTLNWLAGKLEDSEGLVLAMRAVRTVQMAIVGFYIYHFYLIFAG